MPFWCENNPEHIYEKPLNPLIVAIWWGLWQGGEVGSFLWPNSDVPDLEGIWFQQDDATYHTAHDTVAIMHEKFGQRIISNNATVAWHPRSCDLTHLLDALR